MPILLLVDFRELANFFWGNLPNFPENVKICGETSTYLDPKNFAIRSGDLDVGAVEGEDAVRRAGVVQQRRRREAAGADLRS